MDDIIPKKIQISSCEVHYLSAGESSEITVILLHGMKFQARTWQDIGTLDQLVEAGFQAIAVDMPGFGQSPACSVEQDSVLETFVRKIGRERVVLVGPSMGGRIALEFTIKHPELIRALVLVGAVGVEENRGNLPSITVPTLLVWGSDDQISPLVNCQLLLNAVPGSRKIIIEGASHPCYLDNPDTWHTVLLKFLSSLEG